MNPPLNPARTSALRWLPLLALLLALNWVQSACAQSYVLTNLWSVAPQTNTIINNDGNLCRGLAFNPVTGHLLVVSRGPVPDLGTNVFGTNGIYIVDSTNGTILGKLAYDTNVINGGNFAVSMIGVTDDGVIYVGNLTVNTLGATGPFKLYRWANESAQPQLVYSGDPSGGILFGSNPQRFGDSIAVRGTGAGTQILLGTFNQTLGLLTTTDGVNFTASLIVTTMAVSDSRWGVAWGAGDTCYVKQGISGSPAPVGHLRQLSLDLVSHTATVLTNIALTPVAGYGGPLDVDLSRNLIAVIDSVNHKLLVYDISDPSNPIQQDTTKSFPAANANGNFVGSVAFRNGKLFALESNNGILAYSLGETSLPATIVTQPASITLWQGATYTIRAVYGGTPPFSYQWQFAGTNIPGATQASLTITNISFSQAGAYSVAVSNSLGGAVSTNVTLTVSTANPSEQVTKLWDLPAGTRPYLTYRPAGESLIGYKEYGVAINPVNNHIIVVTRLDPTNMIAVLDSQGNHLHYIDYSGLNVSITSVASMNKVDVADDGTVYVCNFAGTASPFIIYGFGDDSGTTADKWVAFNGDPANGATGTTNNWGYTFSVRGSGLDTEILIGSTSGTQRNFAILKPDASYVFHSTFITVDSTVTAGFCRLGMDWGPSPNTVWAKSNAGNLYLIQYDLASGTASALSSYPQTVTLPNILRTVPYSATEIKYDPLTGLLGAFRNGSPPSPVSILLYDVSSLDQGPFMVDQEFFTTYNADIEFQGAMDFANGNLVTLGENNGLMLFHVNTNFASIPVILSQPASATVFAGTPASLSVVADSAAGMTFQWYLNGQSIPDATSATYDIPSVQTNQAGLYTVRVSNLTGGYRESAPAILTVLVPYQTAQMTNIWSLSPGDRYYLNTDYMEYGMAFNPVTTNLLVISLQSGPTVAVLDALTGADKNVLDVSMVSGTGKVLHKIDVADDGVVYACNLTTASATAPFTVYRWQNDAADTVATVAFSGDPGGTVAPNKGCGYTFDVRGAGVSTEILVGMGAWGALANVVSILTTTDGTNFTANPIQVPDAPLGFSRLGLCFGSGNTFWTKSYWGDPGGPLLELVRYDPAAGTGTNLYSNPSGLPTASSITTIGYDDTLKMLAGIGTDTGRDSVQVFDVSNLAAGPQLRDQELFPTGNPSIEQNGAITFGLHTYLFALAENNGIMAFRINPTYGGFKILGVTPGTGSMTLSWQAVSGSQYQVQRAATVSGGWTDLGSVVTAAGDTASYRDTDPDPSMRFYRVLAK